MDMHADILSFLDLLDLDEEVIDSRLKSIMIRSNHTNLHLTNAIQLLQYKNLINTQENSDCDNNIEYDFTIKLLENVNSENVALICEIVYIVLGLNTINLIIKSEHLMQQILFNLELCLKNIDTNTAGKEGEATSKIFLDLKICESVLDAVIAKNEKVSLLFSTTPLEEILSSTDEKLKLYFMNSIVPKLFEGVIGYNILDRIWSYIKQSKEEMKHNSLKTLSCLSDYYLPTPDTNGKVKYESEIIYLYEFWDFVLYGMISDDSSTRKISVYLSKKAVDCVIAMKKDICVQDEKNTIFQWTITDSKYFKNMWDNYFILIDSLEEKQSNIVLPSLKLFESLSIEECWLNAAFNIGLKHDSTQVRLKCIEYRLLHKIKNQRDALLLLEAFNNTNIYDHIPHYTMLKTKLSNLLVDHITLLEILKVIPAVKWSPVPFYFITDVLSNLKFKVKYDIIDTITKILKVSCTNVVIRRAAYYNIALFINNCVENLNWKDIINFYSIVQHYFPTGNPFDSKFKNISLNEEALYNFFTELSENSLNIDLILYYLSEHGNHLNTFIDILNKKMSDVHNIVNRQYSDKSECLQNVILLVNLISKTKGNENESANILHKICARQNKILLAYILSLFSSDIKLTIDVCMQLFDNNNYEFMEEDLVDTLLELYKTCTLFLKDVPELDKAVLSIFNIKILMKHPILNYKYKHEMINLTRFLQIVSDFKFKEPHNQCGVGRWKNIFYEKSCEIIYLFIEEGDVKVSIKQLVHYLENVLECGGYGCLKWILKILNKTIQPILSEEKFNMTQFINKLWNEIEELKTNNQYTPCIEQFVELITQDAMLEKAMYNNMIILYCNRIIEYGPIKTNPLYYLTLKLSRICVTEYSQLVYILFDILLYCPIVRKDDRITNNVSLQILQDSTYGVDKNSLDVHFNYEIQYLSIKTLCSINEVETLNIITKLLTNKIDESFRNKQRYHGGSQPHKMLQLALQHILMISLKNSGNLDWVVEWCLDLMVKLPHQPSVRICLEWLVALYFYVKKTELNEDMVKILNDKKTPLTSQFFILYWLLKHKIANSTFTEKEYEFVLDFLLSHTMGQLFNVRLNAQYLATVLNANYKERVVKMANKFDYTIGVIKKTFDDSKADRTLTKLKNDYFANNFDIITNLNPYFIYYLLPKYCECDSNEIVDTEYVKNILNDTVEDLTVDENFKNEWVYNFNDMDEIIVHTYNDNDNRIADDESELGTIQKKYIPWKNMSDIIVHDAGKVTSPSDLIVVASLIDKLPNLGGMARTSEVFGVKTYVVNSLRHLQDKQFQGLSVSAERWINIEEVRPGRALKEYLMKKKTEGYSVVAAEQTSISSKLQTFKFPKKTLLLLGHEKEGVPCDLLPLMDHCVEIPQQGYVRSLNVHVTAAIFVWEYARQNVL